VLFRPTHASSKIPAMIIVVSKIIAEGCVTIECGGAVPPRSLISCRVV